LRIELQRVHERTAQGANGHPERLQGIERCFYLLQFQHIPSAAALALQLPSGKQAPETGTPQTGHSRRYL
jgi:hypothetical protein